MGNESFDDEKLQNLARYNLFAGAKDISEDVTGKVHKLIQKDRLDNSERNYLLSFIDSVKIIKPKSMTDMKREILTMIGQTPQSYVSNIMARPDVEAVFNWFMENKLLVEKTIKKKVEGGSTCLQEIT